MSEELVRLSRSVVGDEEKAALARVIDGGYLGMGGEVQAFENELQSFLGTDRHVVCVSTGTAALHLAALCMDISVGDEVLVPSLTYVATFQAVAATGATPVACDVSPATGFLDAADAERRITGKTRAIVPVHYASSSDGMAAVYDMARRHGLRVIEDAAHGFGCWRAGAKVGCTGDVVCFSFDGIKNITSGEGGAVVTGDAELARRIRDGRLLGVERDTEKRYRGERSWNFEVRYQGFRYHMSNLMATIGREQLKKLEHFAAHRRRCALRYASAFTDLAGLRFFDLDFARLVPHIFPVVVRNGLRDQLMAHLGQAGIESGVHYKPNHLLDYFRTAYALPVAEQFGAELLSLPLHAALTSEEQERVIAAVCGFFGAPDA